MVHQARLRLLLHPSSRAGRNNNAWSKAKIAPSVRPRRRNGKDTSQTSGKRTKASNATGQHSTSTMHHRTKSSRTFIFLAFKFGADHSTPINENVPFGPGMSNGKFRVNGGLRKARRAAECAPCLWIRTSSARASNLVCGVCAVKDREEANE